MNERVAGYLKDSKSPTLRTPCPTSPGSAPSPTSDSPQRAWLSLILYGPPLGLVEEPVLGPGQVGEVGHVDGIHFTVKKVDGYQDKALALVTTQSSQLPCITTHSRKEGFFDELVLTNA